MGDQKRLEKQEGKRAKQKQTERKTSWGDNEMVRKKEEKKAKKG